MASVKSGSKIYFMRNKIKSINTISKIRSKNYIFIVNSHTNLEFIKQPVEVKTESSVPAVSEPDVIYTRKQGLCLDAAMICFSKKK